MHTQFFTNTPVSSTSSLRSPGKWQVASAKLKHAVFAMAAVSMLFAQSPASAAEVASSQKTIVLVHGAFADGSSWDKVVPLLQAKGFKVVAVQNPLSSLADDVATTKRAIDAQAGQVILVGHSWGGAVITQAGIDDKVKALVYVAAFAPSEAQSVFDTGKDYPPAPGSQHLEADAGGFVKLTTKAMAEDFAQDLPVAKTALLAVSQGPILGKSFGEPLQAAAWKTKPSWYVLTTKDRMILPELQAAMAKKIGATVTSVASSHAVMLSQPQAVVNVILAAAKGN